MALEPAVPVAPISKVEYTCPCTRRWPARAGSCPICGMALEPREVTGDEVNPELADMSGASGQYGLTIPIVLLMISELIPSDRLKHWLGSGPSLWLQFALALQSCSGAAGPSSNGAGCL